MIPTVIEHEGIIVVRDDLYPGGTKARFLRGMIEPGKEYVYASPCEGGAQTSLCTVAREMGAKASIFVAKRAEQHPRVLLNKKLGGKVHQIPCGYLNVVQAAAKKYAAKKKAVLMPFGFDSEEIIVCLSDAARSIGVEPEEVWCASGSGTLMRALGRAWPEAKLFAVQVGRKLTKAEVGGAKIIPYPKPFAYMTRAEVPFPSDRNYDAKCWEMMIKRKSKRHRLFWNVTGEP